MSFTNARNVFIGLAIAGWLLTVIINFTMEGSSRRGLLVGFGFGVAVVSQIAVMILNYIQKNEATAR